MKLWKNWVKGVATAVIVTGCVCVCVCAASGVYFGFDESEKKKFSAASHEIYCNS